MGDDHTLGPHPLAPEQRASSAPVESQPLVSLLLVVVSGRWPQELASLRDVVTSWAAMEPAIAGASAALLDCATTKRSITLALVRLGSACEQAGRWEDAGSCYEVAVRCGQDQFLGGVCWRRLTRITERMHPRRRWKE